MIISPPLCQISMLILLWVTFVTHDGVPNFAFLALGFEVLLSMKGNCYLFSTQALNLTLPPLSFASS